MDLTVKQKLGQGQVLLPGDLDIFSLSGEKPDLFPHGFQQCGIIRKFFPVLLPVCFLDQGSEVYLGGLDSIQESTVYYPTVFTSDFPYGFVDR